ncbi:hypothetical protein AX16_003668 [Volvariella volvacea WC 439]|nr:hypothetical protein AX16_003668 [Volvariella volvacea WC 439]
MFRAGFWQQLLLVASGLISVGATPSPTRTTPAKRSTNGPPTTFVTTENGKFVVNGSEFRMLGTNAYWLPTVNTDEDIDFVFGNMSAVGINAVRIWGFNDVETVPSEGTWFQLIKDGAASVNTGPNGLQKLDKVIRSAQNNGIYVILSLTNNWNPSDSDPSVGPFSLVSRNNDGGNKRPRNTLSNDYGGMDAYVRQFTDVHEHDQFYTNEKIVNAFLNYTTQVVKRYVDSPAILGWELANDPRCQSSLPTSSSCDTNVVTKWHARVAKHVRDIDPNHLVSSGNQGFFCADCPKLFPIVRPPPPQTSPAPGQRRRSVPGPLTKTRLIQERKEFAKKAREFQKRSGQPADGIRVRGRWLASLAARQDTGLSAAFNGAHGVDSEDIGNIPDIGFSSFQLFPDQNDYGRPKDPNLSDFENNVQSGLDWIRRQADTGAL